MKTIDPAYLDKLKAEYCTAVVERMSVSEMRSYLFQIFSNDIAYANVTEMRQKIVRVFGEEFLDTLISDITKQTAVVTEDKAVV